MAPEKTPPPDQTETPASEPQTADDFIRRAWTLHVKGNLKDSEADFRQAQALDARSVEAYYGLGLSLKLQQHSQPALEAFQQAIELAKSSDVKEHRVRASMLSHLASWHVQTIQSGVGQEPMP
ncbi:MAG TPA: tetratricopeptide repeat protein [Anaerolineales bacterium]